MLNFDLEMLNFGLEMLTFGLEMLIFGLKMLTFGLGMLTFCLSRKNGQTRCCRCIARGRFSASGGALGSQGTALGTPRYTGSVSLP